MRLPDGHQPVDFEDVLRSLGALLEEHDARGVLLIESDGGIIVRAHVTPLPAMGADARHEPLERVFSGEGVFARQLAARAHRGSGRMAGPLERDLRVIGRLAQAEGLEELTIIEQDAGAWLLWHRSRGGPGIACSVLDAAAIDRLDTEARAARRSGRSVVERTAVGV